MQCNHNLQRKYKTMAITNAITIKNANTKQWQQQQQHMQSKFLIQIQNNYNITWNCHEKYNFTKAQNEITNWKCNVSGIGYTSLLQEQQIFMKGMIIIAFAHMVLHDSNYQYL